MRRDQQYWLVAGGFVVIFGSTAIVDPFLVQYLLSQGLTGSQVGNLMALVNLIGMALIPLASSRADRSGLHRRVTVGSSAALAASTAAMGLLTNPFLVAAAVIPYRYFSGVTMTLRNRLVLYWLAERNSHDFGSLRLWGSIGFAVAALLGGVIADRTGVPFLFVVSAALVLASLPLLKPFAARLPTAPPRQRRGIPSPALILILVVTGLMALSRTAYNGWVQDFLEDDLNGGASAIGLYMALIALIEVPMMIKVNRLIDRWGAGALWAVGLLFLALGYGLLALTQTVGQALLITLPVGIAQGMTIVASVVLIGQVSDPHNTALNLALAGVLTNLGTMIGSPFAGALYDSIGVRPLFVVGAAAMALTAVILAAGRAAIRRASRAPQPTARPGG